MRRVKRLCTARHALEVGRFEGQEVRDTLSIERAYDAPGVVFTPAFMTRVQRSRHARYDT